MKVLVWVVGVAVVVVGWMYWGLVMEVIGRVPVVGPLVRAVLGFP